MKGKPFSAKMHTLLLNLLLLRAAGAHAASGHTGDHPELLSPGSYDPADVIYRDVAVIGGGAAGTYSAVRLADHNLTVAVVEPKAKLGGHAETYVDPATGVPVNIGVQIFEPFPLTVDFFSRFGVPLVPFSAGGAPPSLFVNFDTGEAVDFQPPSPEEVGAGFAAYGGQLGRHPDIVSGYEDLRYPVDEDLLLPFGEFATKYQIDGAVRSLFDFEQGYSPLLELPAIYVLKQFGPGLLQAFSSGTLLTTERRNTQELYERVTEFLGVGDRVFLNTSVLCMSRGGDAAQPPRILVDGPEGKKLIVARKVLITAPLINVYQARGAFDVNEEEAALFGQLFGNGYYTGIIRNPGLPDDFTAVGADLARPYGMPELPGVYTIRAVPGLPGLFNVYYGIPTPTDPEAVRRDIEDVVGRVLAARGVEAGEKETEWVIFSDHSPYNSMVSPEAIRGGFYKELLGLQGRRDTFYTGATWDTQDSGTIWNYTEERVLPRILESLV